MMDDYESTTNVEMLLPGNELLPQTPRTFAISVRALHEIHERNLTDPATSEQRSRESDEENDILLQGEAATLLPRGVYIFSLLSRRSVRIAQICGLSAIFIACVFSTKTHASFELFRNANTQLFLPRVHQDILDKAFKELYENKSASLRDLMKRYEEVLIRRETVGTCKFMYCAAKRGPTDCLLATCFCKYGHGTEDGEKCVPLEDINASREDYRSETDGTCRFMGCDAGRGQTDCNNSKCLCKKGFASIDGHKCVSKDAINSGEGAAAEAVLMMGAGIVEPDEKPCPESTIEMSTHAMAMITGARKYTVGACRLSIQVYHGSPLPLVDAGELSQDPVENGWDSDKNMGKKQKLYAVITNRQHRTALIQMMSKEFIYAVAAPDFAEGSRRLGNMLHTLTDTWSASHVDRTKGNSCSSRKIKTVMSMDTINWANHMIADKDENTGLFECAISYTKATINLWANIRADADIEDESRANDAIDQLVTTVLCPSLSFAEDRIDRPAGGASATWSAAFLEHEPVLPVGTATEEDAKRITKEWERHVARDRKRAPPDLRERFGHGIFLAGRKDDVCADASLAHVDDDFLQEAIDGKSTNYLMYAPPIVYSGKLNETDETPVLDIDTVTEEPKSDLDIKSELTDDDDKSEKSGN